MKYGILKLFFKKMQVPISVPSSTDLESILSPDPIFSDLQLKEINYNAPVDTDQWPPVCIEENKARMHRGDKEARQAKQTGAGSGGLSARLKAEIAWTQVRAVTS